ncbi:MAG: FxLYD domain-containing protein [Nitrososphaeraceae archaeon]
MQKDFDKSYTVVGEVKNNGSIMAHYVEIISTIYNANNQTLGSTFAFTNPTDLTPGQSAPFDLTLRGSGMDITIHRTK